MSKFFDLTILQKGEYTGDIIKSVHIDDALITNTHYSLKKNNPEWHSHENFHICFTLQGGRADTKKQTLYTQKGGSVFLYHSGELHRWITSDSICKSINIEIGFDFLKNNNISENSVAEALNKNVNSKALILKIQNEMFYQNSENIISVESLLLDLVIKTKNNSHFGIPRWVIILNELLYDNWNSKMTLSQIGKVVGVHPITISKCFRKYFNCSLGEYQRKIKIEKSISLIKNSSMTLTEISYYCGFTDQSHFIRNFKNMTGFLPKQFRKF